MPNEIIASLISSVLGGLMVAVLNYLFTRRKTEAEIQKLKAEAEKIRLETEKLTSEIGNLNTTVQEVRHRLPLTSAVQLRSQMLQELGFDDGIRRIKKLGFFNSDQNKQAHGILHQYKILERKGQKLVIDDTTKLTWQQSGSKSYIVYPDAEKYIDSLNSQRFADHTDWRLPTLDEAMSLMEPEEENENLYINSVFDKTQTSIWTADQSSAGGVWKVDFFNGTCEIMEQSRHYHVRAVR